MKKETAKATGYGLGTVLFDTATHKDITPGLWKSEYGSILSESIKWWDFLAEEAKLRSRVGKKYEYRYNEKRERIDNNDSIPSKGTKSGKDPRDVPILPYPGRLPRVNRPRNVRSK